MSDSQLSNLDQETNVNYNYGNYNPEDVQVEETINAVFVVDKSSSVHSYVNELNAAFNDFTARMQKSHAAPKLLVSVVEFNHKVDVLHGFRPISEIQPVDMAPRIGGTTALYKACKEALNNALNYRKDLENSGVNCKTLMFVITDGQDNESGDSVAAEVKDIIGGLMQEERNFFSFASILFGVGQDADFEDAQKKMGIQHLSKVGTTADEIRKMINFISSSITSVSTGQGFSAPNF